MDRSLRLFGLGVSALLVVGAIAAPARADSAAVLSVRESARVPETVRRDAAVAAAAALADDGVTVRSAVDTEAVLTGDPLEQCAAVDCAAAVAARVGADFVVLLSVFGTAERVASVTVALATADGLSFGGEADVTRDRPLAQAVAHAIAEARIRQGAGTRGTLRIETTPSGSSVHIDGRFRGETPLYRAIEPGPHRVVVSHSGRVRETHDVVITLHGESVLRLALETTPPVAPRRTHIERPLIGPILLGAAGLALVAIDVVGLASLGCIEEQADGVCAREKTIDPLSFALYGGLGVGAIVGAVLWLVLGAHEVVDSPGPTGASVRVDVGLGELSISGRF